MEIKKQKKGGLTINLFNDRHNLDVNASALVAKEYDEYATLNNKKTLFQEIGYLQKLDQEGTFDISKLDFEFAKRLFYISYKIANKDAKSYDDFLLDFEYMELIEWAQYFLMQVYMGSFEVSEDTKKK